VVHEGFIRWDRNEASWADLLDGSKSLEGVPTRDWAPAGSGPALRVIEFGGYRITWEEEGPEPPSSAEAGVRFGHVERIRIQGEDSVAVALRSGESMEHNERRLTLEPAPGLQVVLITSSSDLGPSLREVQVEAEDGEVVRLGWEELAEVEFAEAPPEARARPLRLFGTVEDRWGGRHTGYLSWNDDHALSSDTLVGEGTRGRDQRIPFQEIVSLQRTVSGARVTLSGQDTLWLSWGGDLSANTDVEVSDPELGRVQVRWRDVQVVRFHAPPPAVESASSRGAFDGGRPLEGTVFTVTGEELSGPILWDADEGFSWEILDGRWRDISYDVELSRVASIERVTGGERGEFRGARVTLRDGRVLELSGSNDVDAQNKGILVRVAEREGAGAEATPWTRVRWEDFRTLRFHH
jgi:hypothetical protein